MWSVGIHISGVATGGIGWIHLPHFCQKTFLRLLQKLESTLDTIQNAPKHTISKENLIFFPADWASPLPELHPSGEDRPLPSSRPLLSWPSATRFTALFIDLATPPSTFLFKSQDR